MKSISMKNLYPQINVLLETMQEQFAQIRQYEARIPQIELDMLLSNLRKTYEFVHQINKFNQKEEAGDVISLKDAQAMPVQKDAAFKLKSTSLPFEVPFFNKFKKENAEVPVPLTVPIPQTTGNVPLKPNSGLKLESTTLPPFGPYVTIPKPEISVAPKAGEMTPAAEVKAIEKTVEEPVEKFADEPIVGPIEASDPVSFTTILDNPLPIFGGQATPQPAAKPEEIPAEIKLSFDLPIEIMDQEAMTLARKNIFKEETQSRNPLKKIVDLFEDNLPGHEKFSESFSLLDKFMKKKEDTSLVEKLRHTPVSDLRTAVGVNEKFQFINELFGGNYEDYTASIELLNKCKSFTDAEIFIAENIFDKYKWEVENRNVATFMDLVERRFL